MKHCDAEPLISNRKQVNMYFLKTVPLKELTAFK